MEGFICPICKSDERKPEKLLQHFEEKHSEEKDLVQTFRDVFRTAKKKILKLDESELSRTFETTLKSTFNPSGPRDWELLNADPQDIGFCKDHIEYFKAIRNPRLERYATETNKLIIRLNKLLTNRPTDQQQIKIHEQNVSVAACDSIEGVFHEIIFAARSLGRRKTSETVSIVREKLLPDKTSAPLPTLWVHNVQ